MEHDQYVERLERAFAFSPRIYKAALETSAWPGVLRDLRHAFRAEMGQLTLARISDAVLLSTFDDGITDEQRKLYLECDFTEDPRTEIVRQNMFKAFDYRDYLPDEVWRASDFYKKLHATAGFDYTIAYPFAWEEHDMVAVIAFTRLLSTGPFTSDDLDHFNLYVPHLRRAFEVMMTLVRQRASLEAFTKAFDHIEEAVLIVDRFGQPHHINPAARTILDQKRALSDAHGPIRAVDGPTTERLRSVILRLGIASMTGEAVAHEEVMLPAHDGGLPLYATIAALSETAGSSVGLSPHGGLVGMFITDPNRTYETDTERLQRLFGLTAAEASIAGALIETGSARKIAEAGNRSYETVRSHIKTIRAKVGAANQADLVRLLSQARP